MTDTPKPRYLSAAEAARHLGLTKTAITQAYKRGAIDPAAYVLLKDGESPLFALDVVEAYGAAHRRNPGLVTLLRRAPDGKRRMRELRRGKRGHCAMSNKIVVPNSPAFQFYLTDNQEIMRITADGRFFIKGVETESTDEIRAALLEFGQTLRDWMNHKKVVCAPNQARPRLPGAGDGGLDNVD